jgi:hypothetical protein
MLRVKHFGSLIATPSSTGVWCCLDALAHQSALMRRRPHGWRDRRRQVRSRRRRARDARGLPPASLPSKLEAGITIIASPSSRKRHPPGFTVLSAARSAFEVLQWKMRGLKEAAVQNSRSAPLAPVLFGAVPGAAFACAPMHAAIGGEFATKRSCERPGLEHRQYGIWRVLPYHFGIISATRSNKHLPHQIGSRLRRTGIDVSFHTTSNADTSNPAYLSMAVLRGARCCPNQDQVSIKILRPREGSHAAAARNALRGGNQRFPALRAITPCTIGRKRVAVSRNNRARIGDLHKVAMESTIGQSAGAWAGGVNGIRG